MPSKEEAVGLRIGDGQKLAKSTGALLTFREVCRMLNMSTRTGRRYLAIGALPPADVRLGKQLRRWRPQTIERWIEKQRKRSA